MVDLRFFRGASFFLSKWLNVLVFFYPNIRHTHRHNPWLIRQILGPDVKPTTTPLESQIEFMKSMLKSSYIIFQSEIQENPPFFHHFSWWTHYFGHHFGWWRVPQFHRRPPKAAANAVACAARDLAMCLDQPVGTTVLLPKVSPVGLGISMGYKPSIELWYVIMG